jgi:hypothetical protein
VWTIDSERFCQRGRWRGQRQRGGGCCGQESHGHGRSTHADVADLSVVKASPVSVPSDLSSWRQRRLDGGEVERGSTDDDRLLVGVNELVAARVRRDLASPAPERSVQAAQIERQVSLLLNLVHHEAQERIGKAAGLATEQPI